MYPLAETRMSIGRIADHWQQSFPGRPPRNWLIGTMAAAFWQGQINIFRPWDTTPTTRDIMLESWHNSGDDSVVFFVSEAPEEPDYSSVPENEDIIDDLTIYIVLPADSAAWTDADRLAAFDQLAAIQPEYFPESYADGFTVYQVQRDDFERLCDLNGWDRPAFWFRTARPRESTRQSIEEADRFRDWFQARVAQNKRQPKAAFYQEAHKLFRTLTRAEFNRTWAADAPESWKRRGRIPGRS